MLYPRAAGGCRVTQSGAGSSRGCSRTFRSRSRPGARLGPIDVAYETWGDLAPARDNAVLVLHALTGDSHAAGPAEPGHISTGWWDEIIGPGRAIDTRRWFVVCPNILGGCQGTTGPASASADGRPYGSRFPTITVRDQVAVEIALAEHLAIEQWAAVAGGSMGGMRAIEWAVARPDQVGRAIVIAVGAAATAEQIALSSVQNQVIELDAGFAGGDYYDAPDGAGPCRGLALARSMGQISYRTEAEFAERFGRDAQADERPLAGGRYAIESYLEYHGRHLGRRFDANSYIVLSRAMNHHDVGRDRGGIAAALDTREGEHHDRRHRLRSALPAPPPARARRADPDRRAVRDDLVAVRPRRLPARDRTTRQDHRRRARLSAAPTTLVEKPRPLLRLRQ